MAKPAARLALIQGLLGLAAVAVGARAVMLQVVQHAAWERRAAARDERSREIPARRGTIYDRHGVPLAITQERYRLSIARNELADVAAVKRSLVRRLGIAAAEVEKQFQRAYPYFGGPFTAEEVEPLWRTRGVHFEVLYGRSYPLRPSGRDPLLGYIDVASNRGLDGMEKMLDTLLQGRPGVARMIRDPRGQEIAIPRGILRPAEPGRDVVLTIDHEWQAIAEGVLRRTVTTHAADGGDVVILDVRSGELLAVASLRTPEGGDLPEPTASALVEPYEPGSTAKIFTVAAMLRAGSDTTPVSGEGGVWQMEVGRGPPRTIRDVSRQSGMLTPGLAIKHSSNIAMAKFSLRIPFDVHYETLRDFGIGTATGIGFGGEGPGLLRRPAANPNSLLTQPSWAQGYEFNASAVQLATAYGAIANAGVLLAPSLVHEVRDGATGAVVWRHQAEPVRQVVSPAIVNQLLAYLRLATDSGGSGGRARLDRLPVIGKTGTAVLRNAEGKYQGAGHRASFAGIFPGDDPQVVIYVMIARPRGGEIYGGAIAAPMVRSILQQILATPSSPLDRDDLLERVSLPVVAERAEPIPPIELVRLPLATDQEPAARSIAIPELVGQSSRAAIFRLHQLGLTVRLSGAGTIRGSEPAAGTSVTPGTSVTLFAGSEQ